MKPTSDRSEQLTDADPSRLGATCGERLRVARRHTRLRDVGRRLLLIAGFVVALTATSLAQQPAQPSGEQTATPAPADPDLAQSSALVVVNPVAHDEEIRERLQKVLEATGWFLDPEVRVDEGVVFLTGDVDSVELKTWAGDLARNTQDVVAVVNRMEILVPSFWDISLAQDSLSEMGRDFLRHLPLILFALFILALSAFAALLARRGAKAVVRKRVRAPLLQNVIALCIAGLVFLAGIYLVLRVAGLAQMALTLVGGTGLLGLIVGIAFRDITENFLSSVFLSIQRPFETGDLVEISDVTGYVQQLNIRTTILMTLDGNLSQIPNATVYKSIISNFTTNANRRDSFTVGIGYDDSITSAQELARKVLEEHPAVLKDPEPAVLVDSLGSATIVLRVYFWINGRENSVLKVRSSVIRLVKRAYQQAGISMPDEAREVVFPMGVPVRMVEAEAAPSGTAVTGVRAASTAPEGEHDDASTEAEGGLHSDAATIGEQAKQSELLKDGENLLGGDGDGDGGAATRGQGATP